MEFSDRSPEIELPHVGEWMIHGAGQRPTTLDAVLDAIESAFTLGDRDRFVARLCLDEAITNACEHGGVGPETPVSIDLHVGDGRWALRVRDHGAGYDAETLASREHDPYDEGGRGLPILDGYSERMVVADSGREVAVWITIGTKDPA